MPQTAARLLLPVLALAPGACDRQAGNPAPLKVETPATFPQQPSTIVVPLTAPLSSVAATLDREVPRELYRIDEMRPGCVPEKRVDIGIAKLKVVPRLSCRIVGRVTRGAIRLSGRGDTLAIDMPVNAVIRAEKVGGFAGATATGSAMVHATAKLAVDRSWSPTATVDIRYDWTRPPGIDVLGQRVEFTSKADEKLRPIVAKLERTLPRELAKLRLRQQLDDLWARGFATLSLNKANPPAWMRVTPQRLGFGGYRVIGDRLQMTLAADAITETFVGDRPDPIAPTPLPPPSSTVGPNRLKFFIPVLADYRELEPVVARALKRLAAKGISLPNIGPVDAEFGKVTVYATSDNHLAVGVKAKVSKHGSSAFSTKGEVWLTAVPYNDEGSQVLRARDIRIAGDTDSRTVDLLLMLFGDTGVQETIRAGLTHDFAGDYAKLLADVRREIGNRREGDFVFQVSVDEVRNGRIAVTGQGLFLPVEASGRATIAYQPRG
jgi:hypothetical protein